VTVDSLIVTDMTTLHKIGGQIRDTERIVKVMEITMGLIKLSGFGQKLVQKMQTV